MIVSYPANAGDQVGLVVCRCGGHKFGGHGQYWRKIARVWVQRLICKVCRITVSLLPDSCVPYKHHRTELINDAVHGLLHGRSGRDYQSKVDPSTAYRWRKEFSAHASVLATEGAQRLGIAPINGVTRQIYQRLHKVFTELPANGFFKAVQVQLSRHVPAIGLFRVLTP